MLRLFFNYVISISFFRLLQRYDSIVSRIINERDVIKFSIRYPNLRRNIVISEVGYPV